MEITYSAQKAPFSSFIFMSKVFCFVCVLFMLKRLVQSAVSARGESPVLPFLTSHILLRLNVKSCISYPCRAKEKMLCLPGTLKIV